MKIAVLGSGDMGRTHLSAYSKDERVEIVGVTGRTSASARALANRFDIKWSTDPMQFIEDDSIDAIDIALPTAFHRRFAEAAMENGKQVLVESPMALDLGEAESMIEVAEEQKRILMIAECGRFMPDRAWVHKEMESGKMGRPMNIITSRLTRPYWENRDFSIYGEPLLERMIHDYDMFNWMVGQPVIVGCQGAEGTTGHVERAMVQMWTADGVHGMMELNADMPDGYPTTTRFRVQCEEGVLESKVCTVGEVRKTKLRRYLGPGKPKDISLGKADPYVAECSLFVSCVEGKGDLSALGPKDAMISLQVAKAAQESFRIGKPITLRNKQMITT